MEGRNLMERILSGVQKPTNLPLAFLHEITENFSEKRKIGVGGFGEVYQGVLQNRIVAVKRIIVSEHTLDDRLFDREVKNLMKNISHRNVVRFIGFCSNTHHELIEAGPEELVKAQIRERLLCFEYISNGSLDKHITDELRGLEWSIRYEIIKGICHGLHYLHDENNIIHMDLKPGNIMLDDDMVPKITDFGLSRLDKNTHTSGARFITQGYCAPEYENGGKTSKKADMYSLGVLINEVVTGCKGPPNKDKVLRRWRHRWSKSPKHIVFCQYQQVAKCMKIAAHCMQKEPADRPLLLDIIGILSETESLIGHTDQISFYLDDDMLRIKPLELQFPFELQKPASSVIKLINNTKDYFAFNIETPCRQYRTQPNKGIVPPQSKCSIQITMQTQVTEPRNMPYTDDLIVWSTKVDGDLTAEHITEHVFNKEPGKVDEVILRVLVYDPEKPKGELEILEDTKKKRKRNVESALIEDQQVARALRQAEAVPMDNNSSSYKDARGQRTEQLDRLTFQATPRISRNQGTQMNNRAVDLTTGAMGSLLHKLRELHKEECNLDISAKKEVEYFLEELMDMQLALRNVSQVQRNNLNDHVKCWANSVRDMSYDIEDAIDRFPVHIEHASDTGFFMGLMHKMLNLFKLGKTHSPIDDAIKDIKKQVQVVANRREKWKIDEAVKNVGVPEETTIDPRISDIYKDTKELVGIKEPRDKLINWLSDKTGNEDGKNNQLKIISIVGFGGLGKTTLAMALFAKLEDQFDTRVFVAVGQKPILRKIYEEILRKICYRYSAANLGDTELIDIIRRLLKNKRYLIIIDDLWSIQAWNNIKCAFPGNNCSSRIIATTRIIDVAKSCSLSFDGRMYEMEALSAVHSRRLFFKRIFGSENDCPDMLKEVSGEILKKCGGLPLAIMSISTLLANRSAVKEEWEKVKRSIGYAMEKNQSLEGMNSILSLSYNDLPPNLKTCLLYLSVFPEDYVIDRERLVRRWVAEGFISEERGLSQYEVAESYFYELINKSMVQPVYIDYDGKVRACRVHDMMLEIIISKSVEDNFITVVGGGQKSLLNRHGIIRRLSIQHIDKELACALANEDLSHVRSLTVTPSNCIKHLPNLAAFEALRVLDFEGCEGLEQYDMNSMEKLFQLKYLGLKDTGISKLPSRIGMLRDLETLDFRNTSVQQLPAGFVQLSKLQYLLAGYKTKIPSGIGIMSNLRVISPFNATMSPADALEELGNLIHLNELCVNLDCIGSKCGGPDAYRTHEEKLFSSLHKLIGSNELRSLWISSADGHSLEFLESCSPMPSALQRFCMTTNYFFTSIPKWITPALTSLASLDINLTKLTEVGLLALGELPSLLLLMLTMETGEDRIKVQGIGFQCLKYFKIFARKGTYVTFVERAMPKLEYLEQNLDFSVGRNDGFYLGLAHLPCLNRVFIVVQSESATKSEIIARAAIKEEVDAHTNHPVFSFLRPYVPFPSSRVLFPSNNNYPGN